MGCGSSTDKGREAEHLSREAQAFFPPPEIDSSSGVRKTKTETAPTTVPVGKTNNGAKETSSKVPNRSPQNSPKKVKTAYVPPAPITVLVEKEVAKAQTSTTVAHPSSPKKNPKVTSSIPAAGPRKEENGSDRSLNAEEVLGASLKGGISESFNIQDDYCSPIVMTPSGSEDGPPVIPFDDDSVSQSVASTVFPEPDSSSGMRFDKLYRLKGVLGTGAFSTVREGYHRSNTDKSYAVKCINRKKLSEEDEAALLDEVAILKEMKHIHIIRLYDFFVEPSTYYLVMERMRGGELFDRIVAKAYYNEKEARDTCKILLEAVGYCHINHVAHRDLKPENLLLLSEHDDSAVKIADFGFAKKVFKKNSLTTQCGTPGYVAPEILEGTPYDERADMWSVGVILYILLGGYPPFIESTQRDLFRKIRKGEYEFHEEYWGTVSSEAKELISSLLTVDPNARLTAHQALENSWILGDAAKLAKKDLGVNLEKFRNFNAKRKFRAAVSTVMAVNKLNSLGKDFLRSLKDE